MRIKAMQKKILAWYGKNRRNLPWRYTTNPYHVLLSEIMLQQTQVGRVIGKYRLFTRKYSRIEDLANASTADLIKDWSGLGYNRRVIFLQKCAKVTVSEYNGQLPNVYEALLGLPGIGPYTAAAICSFAYNQEIPCIDTNIRRVLLHELSLPESTSQKELYEMAKECIPKGKSRIWHNALMDYGAVVLTAHKTGIKPLGRQPRFAGSRRFYRGQVIKLLHAGKRVHIGTLKKALGKNENEIHSILSGLESDGLLRIDRKSVSLP